MWNHKSWEENFVCLLKLFSLSVSLLIPKVLLIYHNDAKEEFFKLLFHLSQIYTAAISAEKDLPDSYCNKILPNCNILTVLLDKKSTSLSMCDTSEQSNIV